MPNGFEIRAKLLARNTILNLGGTLTPLIVGIIAIPFIVRGLGIDRFGVLTLMWMVAGYMGMLDLGLGRAMTQLVAERLGKGHVETISGLVWTSLALIFALGLIAGFALVIAAPLLIHKFLRATPELQGETLSASYILAISIPFVLNTTGLRGILEALQRFDLSNAIRIPTGAFSFLGPLLVLIFSHSLVPVVAVLVAGRFVSWLVHLIVCIRTMPELGRQLEFNRFEVRGLISFGGWVTISNIVGPVMTYFDRFLIGAILSVAAVAFYATPFDFVTKISFIPMAIAGVLYPAFAVCYHTDYVRTIALFKAGSKYVFIAVFPSVVVIVTFAHKILALWLGEGFASHSTAVLEWLAIGVFVNGLALIPFGFIQGAGRPDLTAKVHLAELVPYVILVRWLIHTQGINGAAIAWVLRAFVDTLVLFVIGKRLLPRHGYGMPVWRAAAVFVLWSSVLVPTFLLHATVYKSIFVTFVLLMFGIFAWFILLSRQEHRMLKGYLRSACALDQLSGDRV